MPMTPAEDEYDSDELRALADEAASVEQEHQTKRIPVAHVPDDETTVPKSDREQHVEAEKQFSDLYRRSNGSFDSLRHIDRRDPRRRMKIIIWTVLTLLVILGVVLAGFYYFVNRDDKFANAAISITLHTGATVNSGEESTLIISIMNNEAVAITNAELTLQMPESFTFSSSIPQASNEAHNAWDIGTVNPGKEKLVSITGIFLGEKNTIHNFGATLNYTPANFSSVFQTSHTLTVTIGGSILAVDIDAPAKSIAGRDDSYSVTVTNTSPNTIRDVIISVALPEEMTTGAFDPAPVSENDLSWHIDEFAGEETLSITWQGQMAAPQGTSREIIAVVGYTDERGTFTTQAEDRAIVFVVNPQLLITLRQDDSTSGVPRGFGENLTYTVALENASDSIINNLTVELEINGAVLDWSGLIDPYVGEVRGTTIRWTSNEVAALESLRSSETASIEVSIPIIDTYLADSPDQGELIIVGIARAASRDVADLEGQPLTAVSETVTTHVTTNLSLRTEARYYDDEYIQVGSGPVPPQVGETTTYVIYWYLQNTTNEVSTVTVTTTLPKGVVWADDSSVSAGDILYDATERTVSWTINKIPRHVGQYIPELYGEFVVTITPTAAQEGTVVTLLTQSLLTATDSFTQAAIRKSTGVATTDIPTDPLKTGQGEVVPAPVTNTNAATNTNTATNSNTNTN